jgi:hypothetical protein
MCVLTFDIDGSLYTVIFWDQYNQMPHLLQLQHIGLEHLLPLWPLWDYTQMMNRSFVNKAKEGCHVRIVNINFWNIKCSHSISHVSCYTVHITIMTSSFIFTESGCMLSMWRKWPQR